MDLSKLPRMGSGRTAGEPSQEQPQSGQGEPPPPPVQVPDHAPASVANRPWIGEAWLSLAIGAIVLFMQQRFLSWLFGRDFGWIAQEPYAGSLYFINDLGLAAFGLALIVDGILFFLHRPWALWIGLALTALATILNLYSFIRTYPVYGAQIFPAIAVAIGVYTALCQWRFLSAVSAKRQMTNV